MNREEILSLDTSRKIFDYVVNHMKTQGCQSMRQHEPDECAYRGANGTSCAVGCLILDEEYNPNMEYRTLEEVISGIPRLHQFNDLLYSLQMFHDNPGNWGRSNIHRTFSEHGLHVLKEISKTYVD
jgi:hypothetical protein